MNSPRGRDGKSPFRPISPFARATMTDARGKAVAVRYENGRPTFTQPAGRVKVEAVFAPIPRPVGTAPAVALSPQRLTVNGAERNVEAYNIGGANFFGLRELSPFFGYDVSFDEAANTARIESR